MNINNIRIQRTTYQIKWLYFNHLLHQTDKQFPGRSGRAGDFGFQTRFLDRRIVDAVARENADDLKRKTGIDIPQQVQFGFLELGQFSADFLHDIVVAGVDHPFDFPPAVRPRSVSFEQRPYLIIYGPLFVGAFPLVVGCRKFVDFGKTFLDELLQFLGFRAVLRFQFHQQHFVGIPDFIER